MQLLGLFLTMFVVGICLQSVVSLECYYCSGGVHEGCDDGKFSSIVIQKQSVTGSNATCTKILIKIPELDQPVTVRAPSDKGCPTVSTINAELAPLNLNIALTNDNVKIYCCRTNLCNQATHGQRPQVELLLFIVISVLGIYFMKV